jgi:hypothetical protein
MANYSQQKDQNEQLVSETPMLQQTSATNIVETAIAYAAKGLSVIPIDHDKTAKVQWKKYMKEIPTETTLHSWTSLFQNIAIITGKTSGVEVIDIDEKYNVGSVSLINQFSELVRVEQPGLMDRLVIQKTRNNGYHLIYRCSEISGNQTLAVRPATSQEIVKDSKAKSATLIETRGEGGYFVCQPSSGYTVVQNSLFDIPNISPQEHDILFRCARSMNSYLPKEKVVSGISKRTVGQNRPGDNFNEKGSVDDTLKSEGWELVKETSEQQFWCRPGKKEAISATFNKAMQLFYVFSSNAEPFEPLKAYSKFSVITYLKHDKKYDEAAKALVAQGFGQANNSGTNLARVEEYLATRYKFRYNEITQRVEMSTITSEDFSVVEDYDFNSILRELEHNNLSIGNDSLHHLLESDFTERIDIIKSYFEELPKHKGTEDYIGQLAKTIGLKHEEESVSFAECLKRWLVGQVACAQGRAVNQTAIVFVGSQGIGKTTWLNRLIPPPLSVYRFVGTINPDNKDTQIYLSEKILINLDELETLSKIDIGSLKTSMTLDHINVRRPYGHFPSNLIRRASFVGSINNTDFLTDASGSRRFLVFEVNAIDLRAEIDMDKVYAQACDLLASGYRWWFNGSEIDQINERNRRYMRRSHEHELLNQFFKHGDEQDEMSEWMTASGVALRLSEVHRIFNINDKSVRSLGIALTAEKYPI